MFQPVSLFIGLRYSRFAKGNAFISFISFFSISGIALGIMALFTVVSVMNGFEQNLKSSMLGMIPHIELTSTEKTDTEQNALIDRIKGLEGVVQVGRYRSAEAVLQTNLDMHGVLLEGIYSDSDFYLEPRIEQGSWQGLYSSRYRLALSRYLATKLGVGVGDEVRVILPAASNYTPLGRVPSQRLFIVAAIYATGSEIDTGVAFTSGDSLARLMRKPQTSATDIRIMLQDPFDAERFVKQHAWLAEGNRVSDWRKSQGTLFSAVAMEKHIMSLLLGLIVLVAVFNIVSALAMMVSEKQGEVAILQTLGLTPWQVKKVFMVQGLYNGVFGTLVGTVAGVALTANINEILTLLGMNLLGGMRLPVLYDATTLCGIAIASIFMSFLATLYPAQRAAAIRPAEVLRYE